MANVDVGEKEIKNQLKRVCRNWKAKDNFGWRWIFNDIFYESRLGSWNFIQSIDISAFFNGQK